MASMSPGSTLGRIRSFAFQIAVRVLAFHQRGKERRVAIAGGAARGLDVLRALDHRNIDGGIFRQAYLGSTRGVGANRLHRQTVRQYSVVAHLVHLRRGQLEPRRKLAIAITEVGKAGELVGGHEVMDAVRELLGYISRVVGKGLGCVARLPAARAAPAGRSQ